MRKAIYILFSLMSFYSFAQTEATDSNIKQKINQRNNKIIIVDFYANWCGPCVRMNPILKEVAQEYRSSVEIYKINVDNNYFDDEKNVNSIPTMIFYKNGRQLKRTTGGMTKQSLVNTIKSLGGTSNNTNNNTTYNNSGSGSVTEAFDHNIQSFINKRNNKIILVDFYANWCGPCRQMDPILKEIARENPQMVEIYKLNVDKNRFDDQKNVRSIPTMIFYKNGKQVKRTTGGMSKQSLVNTIKSLYGNSGGNNTQYNNGNNSNDKLSDAYLRQIWNDQNALNNVAWNAYENETSTYRLNQAIKAVKRSIQLNDNYYNRDTYAALLHKKGNQRKALKQSKRAIEHAKRRNINYDGTIDLMLKIIGKM